MIVAEGTMSLMLDIRDGPRLQWGRNLIVAEGILASALEWHDSVLQWGRNLIVAEG